MNIQARSNIALANETAILKGKYEDSQAQAHKSRSRDLPAFPRLEESRLQAYGCAYRYVQRLI